MTDKAQSAAEPMREVLQEILDIEEIRLWLIEKDHFSDVYWFKAKEEDYAARLAGLLDKVRAALKAQPAPTEAQGDSFDPKDETIKKLQGLIDAYLQIIAGHEAREKRTVKYANSAQMPASAAQGEDSARLDAARYRFASSIDGDRAHIDWSASKDEIDAAIDRARASAETGGVKS